MTLVVGLFYFIFNTTTGLRAVLAWVPNLQVRQVEGKILGNSRLQGLHWQTGEMQVHSEQLQLRWQPASLLRLKLHIQTFSATVLHIQLPAAAPADSENKTPLTIPDIQLPVALQIDNVLLRQFQLQQGEQTYQLQQANLSVHSEKNHLILNQLALKSVQLEPDIHIPALRLQGRLNLQKPYDISLEGHWNLLAAVSQGKAVASVQLPQSKGRLQLAGDSKKLSGLLKLDSPQDPIQIQLNFSAENLLKPQLAWQADLMLKDFDSRQPWLQALVKDLPDIQGRSQWRFNGDLKNIQVQSETHGHITPYGPLQLHISGKNKNDWLHWAVDEMTLSQPDSALEIHANAALNLQKTPEFNATLNWKSLQWPLQSKTPQVFSPTGQLQISGTPDNWQLQGNSDFQGLDIPESQWQLTVSGSQKHLQLQSLSAEILGGKLNLSGDVGLKPHLSWELALDAQHINPAVQWQAWPGQLALNMRSSGKLGDKGQLQASIPKLLLHGTLQKHPLHLQSQVEIHEQQYHLQQFDAQIGKTKFQLQGHMQGQEKLNLQWQLNARHLEDMLPQLFGSVQGKGTLAGSLKQLAVDMQLDGKKLKWQDSKLNKLTLRAQGTLSETQPLQLKLTARELTHQDININHINLLAQGNLKQHTLQVDVQGKDVNGTLQLSGTQPKTKHWRGSLSQLQLNALKKYQLQLEKPVTLAFAEQQLEFTPLCLQLTTPPKKQQTAKLCADGRWLQQQVQVSLDIKQLTAAQAGSLLPAGLDISGTQLDGQLQAQLDKNGSLHGKAAFQLSAGKISYLDPEETTEQQRLQLLEHQGGHLQARLNNKGLHSQLQLRFNQQDKLEAQLKLPALNHYPLAKKQPLNGLLNLHMQDFSLLPIFLPDLNNPQGTIKGQLKINGDLEKPLITGEIKLQDGKIEIEPLGLRLRDIEVALAGDQTGSLKLQGQIVSGEAKSSINTDTGKLDLNAAIRLKPDWQVQGRISGKNFEMLNTPQIWLLASPDIMLQADAKAIKVNGKLLIPEALITPPELQGSVQPSSDVRIINPIEAVEEKQKTGSNMPVNAQIQVVLGDKVRVKGMGFKGRLQGELGITQQPGEILTGNGRIGVAEGTYKAYGQNLKITKGYALYTDGPLDNPGLDVRAVRELQDVTVGIDVTGNAKKPHLELFSQPQMDQTNILSWLVLGRPASELGKGGGNDSEVLMQAVSAMALDEDSSVVNNLRNELGLDVAGLESQDGEQGSTFMLGKYLTPDLYMGYGIGLFDAVNIFKVRYNLTRNITVEADTSAKANGMDIRYTLER
ncbi:translocation/assembly module TamB domain-containing protein [Candidatus Venteria ishoeyi]|nr:translocation/assembly module TamB domain-containing protein [Candidatus Venteria ishoeyi]